MKNLNVIKKQLFSFVVFAIFASVLILASCEAVTGPGGLTNGETALAASRSKVNVGAPIIITTDAQLAAIGDTLPSDEAYQLGADLTLTDWTPICGPGSRLGSFTGTFDGAGHTITVNSFTRGAVNSKYLGIFAVIGDDEGAPSVSNLNVSLAIDPVTTSAQYVGGVAGHARDAAFYNITIRGGLNVTQNPNTPNNFNVGGVAGFAASSSFNNISVNVNFNTVRTVPPTLPSPKWKIWRGDGSFQTRAFIGAELAITGEDGVTTGGIAGAVKFSQFRAITVNGDISARGQTQGTPAYVGGVVGYATGAAIDNANSGVNITGRGPGYNSSAGGIAGYVTNTTVRDSYAEGSVELYGESLAFGWDASWQVYAGGLVGYAGGSEIGASLIDHSHASGFVYAYSPFPYAGGIVGYLYGYNDFTNPAKNGSTVSRSYAESDVIAESQPDMTSANNGDIPYAGGLVGYSSVAGSTIVDSYATNYVETYTRGTYAWAGGIVGGNANNAVVLRTYATGDVWSYTGSLSPLYAPDYTDPGPAAGGIAGFNYYSAATLVTKSVALNSYVYGNQRSAQDVAHRVVGSLGNTASYIGTLATNYANIDMNVDDYWKQHKGFNNVDGADADSIPPRSLYASLDWDFASVWQLTGTYPTLR
jgi:hypothetical protein